MLLFCLTVQFPSETYQPLVFGPFNKRDEAFAFGEDIKRKYSPGSIPHVRVSTLEKPIIK